MKKGDEEYQKLLKEFIKEKGPNPGNGQWGSLAWYVLREREFVEKMIKEGKLEEEIKVP